ncbi:metallophosphoesterase [Romeria aff. gracilis LEGE 07310]|uniref:Metallophosphoesterase n=1 Tax=Vasconcelosia minhoensis LEGE 07310 TaxID=915328 RepID=A0A8J7DP95_9CYAN|nr:metallophosphoesterase [Romeria gracilis]MBE9079325.1 metallophosphoesterase [Romeria aff. gracilis LEGE 07310]
MSFNRRRFILLGGLALGAAPVIALQRSSRQAEAEPVAIATKEVGPEANLAAAPAVRQNIGPSGLYAPPRGDIRVVVISDLNSRYGSTDYRQEVIEGVQMLPDWQPDLVICGGDMVAGQSISLTQPEIEAMWTAFDRQILSSIRAAGLPFAFTVGNHDASSVKQQGEFVYVLDRQEASRFWQAHEPDTALSFIEDAGFPYYYSFKQNDIFYLVWDASSANVAPEQVAWADRSLGSPEAQSAKLRIVLGHLPFYAVSQGRDRAGEILNQADQLRAMLERHQVSTYISGHHHAYFPGHAGQLNFLHAGALGSGPRSLLNSTGAPFQTLTVMDIFLDVPETVYTTYNMNTRQVVDRQNLPRQIVGPNGRELRQDLTLADLSEAEQNQAYVPSAH